MGAFNSPGEPVDRKLKSIEQAEVRRRREEADRVARWTVIMFFMLAVLVIVVFKVVVASGLIGSGGFSLFSAFDDREVPPAGVYVDSGLEWREVDRILSVMYFGGFLTGDFNGDGDTELLYCGKGGKSKLIGLDGATQPVAFGLHGFSHQGFGWDINGDGVDEVITNRDQVMNEVLEGRSDWDDVDEKLPPETPVFSLTGEILQTYHGRILGRKSCPLGDFNGDGTQDIALFGYDDDRDCLIQTPVGEVLGSVSYRGYCDELAIGDFDGDGCDELALETSEPKRFLIVEADGATWDRLDHICFEHWREWFELGGAADLNGDGVDDIITLSNGWVDPVTGVATPWEFPPGPSGFQIERQRAVAGDFNADGVVEVAVMTGLSYYGTGVMVFEPGGRCIHYESFGKTVETIYSLASAGCDHLVVIFDNYVISWP